ncbi:hypothetical protein [Undibacterium curvum]|uniref:Uncharacterized protein n=1 Tax=Undibacterium curvum TaxID=2762294 RepID=A0ABR7A0X9_9BURK|nr:hypothetical protein [Undibacterium curvum]MBC3930569.1 hypothetical protein [Undibacterium curvum]
MNAKLSLELIIFNCQKFASTREPFTGEQQPKRFRKIAHQRGAFTFKRHLHGKKICIQCRRACAHATVIHRDLAHFRTEEAAIQL